MKNKLFSLFLVLALMISCVAFLFPVEADTPLAVTGVGIFDQDPAKGMHTFDNGARLLQVTFNRDFWAEDTQNYVELNELINTKLLIDGKTPSQWVGNYGDPTWGCVTAHVKRSAALGQYLEINLGTNAEGLPTEDKDCEIRFLKGFAGALASDVIYRYTAGSNAPFSLVQEPLAVTGVGIFDQDPAKGMHTFDNGARLLQVTFNRDFWAEDTQNYVELNELINTKLLIDGKTPSQWVGNYGDPTWGCVTAHVKRSATFGQYLEINLGTNAEGLPTEGKDCEIRFLKGFAGQLESESVWSHRAADGNVPFTAGELPATATFDVIGVGVLDQQPNKSYVDFGTSYLWQALFGKELVPTPENVTGDKLKTFVQMEYGSYIYINGKSVAAWNRENYNSVMVHIGYQPALGQYLEFNTVTGLDGLIAADNDNVVTFVKGLPGANGEVLENNVTYKLPAGSTEAFVRQAQAETFLPDTDPADDASTAFDVKEIGVLDQYPKKALQDFGSTYLWQIRFTKNFFDPGQIGENGRKDHVQDVLGDYIYINGKSVTQWNAEVFNSVMIHVVVNPAYGQYLEMNTNCLLDGLIDETTDNVVTIMKGLPCFGGEPLAQSVSYKLAAGSVLPFVRLDAPVLPDGSDDGKDDKDDKNDGKIDIEPDDGKTDTPKTGDTGHAAVAAAVCALALAAALAAGVPLLRRRSRD